MNAVKLQTTVQFSSLAQSCLAPCDPMDCNTPGLPVHCQLLEFTQTHVHWVSDAIHPSHPLLSPSPLALRTLWTVWKGKLQNQHKNKLSWFAKYIFFENEIRQTDCNSTEIIQMKVSNEGKNDYTENNT